jgi:hypothetical protein
MTVATRERAEVQGIEIEKVIAQVKEELAVAQSAAPSLELKKFDLELSLVSENSGEGGLKIPIFGTIGPNVKGSNSRTKTLSVSYEPPKPKTALQSLQTFGLAQALATLEQSIKAGLNGTPPLEFTEGKASFEFGVKLEGGVTLSFWIIEAGVAHSRQETNTITLTFGVKA